MRMQAVFNGVVLADSEDTKVVEGNHYFPPESISRAYFADSSTRTLCYWKGMASYYTLDADGVRVPDSAWYYPKPSPLAKRIKNHVAFGGVVEVTPAGKLRA